MAAVVITYVGVLSNPAPFTSPLMFNISYECLYDLPDDLEWKVTYVGSSEDATFDQVLETIYVGPVTVGQYQFTLEAPAPDPARIPPDELVGVTALLLTCSYRGKEFTRVGYFVNNEYESQEDREMPPDVPDHTRLIRSVLSDKPRVTKFPIDFGAGSDVTALPQAYTPTATTGVEQAGGQYPMGGHVGQGGVGFEAGDEFTSVAMKQGLAMAGMDAQGLMSDMDGMQ